MEEVKLAAAKIGLPATEAEKFFYHYDSVGWKIGKNPMVRLASALQHWKIVWREMQTSGAGYSSGNNGRNSVHTNGKTWAQREVDRICRDVSRE